MKTSFERVLVEQCAPVLANIKPGSLFCYHFGQDQPEKLLHTWRKLLSQKGISIDFLRLCPKTGKHLILVYRQTSLQRIFSDPMIQNFLNASGYIHCASISQYIETLRLHFSVRPEFPHEIGLFLGYPLEDVQGFIEHNGRNYCYCDCWKVYGNKERAKKRFEQYKKCSRIYRSLHAGGRDIMRLIVAA